jgi:hypothetical protein
MHNSLSFWQTFINGTLNNAQHDQRQPRQDIVSLDSGFIVRFLGDIHHDYYDFWSGIHQVFLKRTSA